MKIKVVKIWNLIGFVLLIGPLLIVSKAAGQSSPNDIVIDFSKTIGQIKALHGVNGGPFRYGMHQAPIDTFHIEAGFPDTRLHDVNWPHPDAVDINTIFPIFDLDADDPKNYTFDKTDEYLAPIIKNKSEIIYRLGYSIEHYTHHFTHPPKDFKKWTKICLNIIRHYNDGWDHGFHDHIKYWEIWNEPETKLMWSTGTQQQYFDLYEMLARAIKAHDPSLKVGGPAAGIKSVIIRPFLAYCRDHSLPLDFFSWHIYTASPGDIAANARMARQLLDEYGYKKTESHMNEWHYIQPEAKRKPGASVMEAYAANIGSDAAVFAASVLMLLQDCRVDVANYYCADYSPWSMFDVWGVPSKTYYVFKAFNQLTKTPVRVAVEKAADSTAIVLAGKTADGGEASFLINNTTSDNRTFHIALKNFAVSGKIGIRTYVLDEARNLELRQETKLNAGEAVLTLELPAVSVCLVKLGRD